MYKVTIRDEKCQHYINAKELIMIALDESGGVFYMTDCEEELLQDAVNYITTFIPEDGEI